MSFGMSAFQTLMRRQAYHLASLRFTLAHDTGHVVWHICTSHVVNLDIPLGTSYAALQTLFLHVSACQSWQTDM